MGANRSNAALDEYKRRDAKLMVVDTSVVEHDPCSINKLQKGNIVVLPWCLVEELDRHRSEAGLAGYNAQQAIDQIDTYSKLGSLREGVHTKDGGLVLIDHENLSFKNFPQGTARDKRDNLILATGMMWREKKGFTETRIVSKDANIRIKANVLGIVAEDYWDDKISVPFEKLYKGFTNYKLSDQIMRELQFLFYQKGSNGIVSGDFFEDKIDLSELYPNQCCYFWALEKPERQMNLLAMYKRKQEGDAGYFTLINKPVRTGKKIGPKNDEQAFAYALLCDSEISLVTLAGKAGTGKTLMSILAASNLLDKEQEEYRKISVFRPIIEVGRGMGFLPGKAEEKFEPWTIPIVDCLSLIGDGELGEKKFQNLLKGKRLGQRKETERGMEQKRGNFSEAEELINAGLLEMSPLTYIRGRSLHYKFVIVDECQNLTPHEVKTIITRAGKHTKIVLTGDLEQIDNRFLDETSNGLSHAIDRFKGKKQYGHITLVKSERSELAEMAADLL